MFYKQGPLVNDNFQPSDCPQKIAVIYLVASLDIHVSAESSDTADDHNYGEPA